jgi:hypothetical protein
MMTNAEKYQEVFGFPPDTGNCPTDDCKVCPCSQMKIKGIYECMTYDWWNKEYKE